MADQRFVFLALVIFAGAASAVDCAEKTYSSMCGNCTFDANGKVDDGCWQGYQARGVACFATSYPAEMTMYEFGQCPAVDVCIQRLDACRARYGSGSDKADCGGENVRDCFSYADACAADAVKDCKGTPPDRMEEDDQEGFCEWLLFGFVLVPLAFFYHGKQD